VKRLGWTGWPGSVTGIPAAPGASPLPGTQPEWSQHQELALVDRGIRVQALGRGARVQSLAETAQSPRTNSALAQRWAAKWIASPSDFTSPGSCCWWMPDIAGAVGGTAMITSAFQGTPERAGVLAPWPADPRSFAVDHSSLFSACSCSVV
jgi:hypothetical protein